MPSLESEGENTDVEKDGSRFARELQRSELALLSRSGHDAPEESPDQVNGYLLAYLKDGLSRIPENVAWH